MKHYLFEVEFDEENPELEGMEFIVGAESKDEAIELATDISTAVRYICRLTDEEAEMSGLDEY